MTPDDAAALLGIETGADRSTIQAAFRSKVRAAHPDGAQDSSTDIDHLVQARDTLLAPPTPTKASTSSPTTSASKAAPPSTPASTPRRQPAPDRTPRVSNPGCLVALAAGALGFFALVAVVVVGIVTTSGDDGQPAEAECIVVLGAVVNQVSCDSAGAQRIVARLSGARTCPPGQSALVSDSETFCLAPAE